MRPTPQDYTEISNVLAHYCLSLDHDDFEGWYACFTPEGGMHTYGRSFLGEKGLRKVMDTAPRGLHHGGPPAVEILSDDRARVRQNLWFVDRVTKDTRCTVYEDEWHRTADGWRIHSRTARYLTPDGVADKP